MAPKKDSEEAIWSFCEATRREISKILIGYREVVDNILTALLAHGHVLIIGLPGLGKTLLVRSLAHLWNLEFKRIQFTPDLTPSDITGSEILQENPGGKTRSRYFEFVKGPIFANLILADEINRATPRTQSALLQAMEEREVTVGGKTYNLPEPFTVMATQNPLELEGTFPLPEAQLDRFLLSIELTYPEREDEIQIALLGSGIEKLTTLNQLPGHQQLTNWQKLVDQVAVPDSLLRKIVDTVRNTRPQSGHRFARYLDYGAGPRATQFLIRAARARSLMEGSPVVTEKIARSIVHAVLAHRLKPSYLAISEKLTIREILDEMLEF
ncbi:MAG: MoxR family ATPase [Leptospiraceae bacterium]|nr:MoxR family ATPase [Leptospiraceae bacterium]MDW8307299.1 MoxR family ATPase [Leptospiraceae bacterium]